MDSRVDTWERSVERYSGKLRGDGETGNSVSVYVSGTIDGDWGRLAGRCILVKQAEVP